MILLPGTDPSLKWLNPPGALWIKVVVTIEETDWALGDRGPVLVGPVPFAIRWHEPGGREEAQKSWKGRGRENKHDALLTSVVNP